ncbi:hypothetical protein [Nocardia salmonicida]|uniref:hypothetical protein n=1 Tax=Nocardia salmonicida TaxID=53431 RepID=UPI0034064C82
MADVVGLVQETAKRIQDLPADTPAETVMATANAGFGAVTLAAAVLRGNSPASRADEFGAIALSVVAANERISEVVDEDLVDAALDERMVALLSDAENLARIRASSRWLREAATHTAAVTHTALTELARSESASPEIRDIADLTAGIAENITVLLDVRAETRAERTVLAAKIIEAMTG